MRKISEQFILISLWSIFILILIMSTLVEQKYGVEFIHQKLYHNIIFLIFNTILFFITGYFLLKNVTKQIKSAKFQLYFAFFWILIGAFFTYFNAKETLFTLQQGNVFTIDGNNIQLANIKEYSDNNNLLNHYSADIQITEGKQVISTTLAANKIYRYKGYRFYLTQIKPSQNVITIKAVYNPWGTIFTYIGYAWFLIAFLILVCRKEGRFRQWARRAAMASTVLLFFSPQLLAAQRTLTPNAAKEMGKTIIAYQGRIAPIETLCDDWLFHTYGKKHYKNYSSVQVVFGWVLFPEDWAQEPLFKIGHNQLSKSHYVSLNQLFSNNQVLTEELEKNKKINQSLGELQLLRRGDIWKIYPASTQWLSPIDSDSCPEIISQFFPKLYQAIQKRDEQSELEIIHSLQSYQHFWGATEPSVQPELLYNDLFRPALFGISLIFIGLISFIIHIIKIGKSQSMEHLAQILRITHILFFALITLILGLRWYIGKHIPLSNGCETLLFVSWMALLISIIINNQYLTLRIAGCIIAGFALLATTFAFNSTAITPLTPALNSSLLSVHVVTIMIAYTLLAFTFFTSLSELIRARKQHAVPSTAHTQMLLIPAVGLLALGIILGSLWANISWGSYWSWDTKEVWALITLILYSAPLCEELFPLFKRATLFHIFIVIAFFALLMTYFGVNILFVGMHSYA